MSVPPVARDLETTSAFLLLARFQVREVAPCAVGSPAQALRADARFATLSHVQSVENNKNTGVKSHEGFLSRM